MKLDKLFGKSNQSVNGYPNPFATPEEKEKKEYGLQYIKRMYHEWKDNSQINTESKQSRYAKARSYAQGSQSVAKYKDLLDMEGDTSYLNLDWTPVNIVPKFLDLIVNELSNQDYEVLANAIDPLADTTREKDKLQMFASMMIEPGLEQLSNVTGYDVTQKGYVPRTQEEPCA